MVSMRAFTYEPVRLESQVKFSQTVREIEHQKYTTQPRRQEPEENGHSDAFNTAQAGTVHQKYITQPRRQEAEENGHSDAFNTAQAGTVHQKYITQPRRQEPEANGHSDAFNTAQAGTVREQERSPVDDTGVCSSSTHRPPPLCRQFWKAGNYDDANLSKVTLQNGKNYLHVHPMFLHSNATSHKWAFGAIAELLDNAIDEIHNGATVVIVDKVSNPRDGGPALLIQDDGGGMDPEAIRRCMSFGFSDKKSTGAIGQYGNGFKTSSMRLGADVIVFTRHGKDRTETQSIGLLSYSFLMHTGHDRIIVPMVDYEFNKETGQLETSCLQTKESFTVNLSLLKQWSPYSSEAELLKQFDDIGQHGTKVVIYNLWYNDDGNLELDFETDPKDIRIDGNIRKVESLPAWKTLNEQHIGNRLHHSLHAYLSILYLRVPETFSMILRGQAVTHYNLAADLKYPEFILYRPQAGGNIITTIGFVKDAPRVCIHGFNIYYRNRLIQPFMQAVHRFNTVGRGVVGILEANFIEPTHNKQEFERTSLFQKLEVRLKDMTMEYWRMHCGLIGYNVPNNIRKVNSPCDSAGVARTGHTNSVMSNGTFPNHTSEGASSSGVKRKEPNNSVEKGSDRKLSRTGEIADIRGSNRNLSRAGESADIRGSSRNLARAGESADVSASSSGGDIAPGDTTADEPENDVARLMEDRKGLLVQLEEYEKRKEELKSKVTQLTKELEEVNAEYKRMMAGLTWKR